jgi:dTDP-4-dehydrorhamnose reductase
MAKKSILGTGLSGLVGSKLSQTFSETYDFTNLDVSNPEHPVDITDYDQVLRAFSDSPADFVAHFAAFTDVTKAWEQRDDKNGIVYKVNVLGTENIVKAATATGKHLIHISTAYVFDGNETELYSEEDPMNPIEWYGQTKAWAEEKVMASTSPWTILRIDQPFRSDTFPKQDIAHRIIAGLQNGTLYPQFTNHYFGPTFIDDFAQVIEWVFRTSTTGLFHASSGEKWSDYDFAELFKQTLQLQSEVKQGDLDTYLKTLNRPYQRNTAMNCEKLKRHLDFELTSIEKAAAIVKA